MGLKEKFSLYRQWQYFEQTRVNAPDTEYSAVIETSDLVTQWPEDVVKTLHIPDNDRQKHIYTICAKGEALEKFCSQPIVIRLTL